MTSAEKEPQPSLYDRALALSGTPRLLIPLALLAVYVIWGSTYLALRWVVEAFPPLVSAGARFFVAGSLLFTIAKWRGAPTPTTRELARAAPPGLLLFVVGNGFVAIAEREVSSAEAAIVCGAMPLVMVLLGAFAGERPKRVELAGLVIGFAGVAVMTAGGMMGASLSSRTLLLLLAPLGWALGSRLTRRPGFPAGLMGAALPMMIGGVGALLLGAATGESFTITALPLRASLAFLYLIFIGSMVAFTAYAYLLRNTRASVATSYAYVNPAIATALGVALGGETVGLHTLAGGALVILGVGAVIALRGETPRPAPLTTPLVQPLPDDEEQGALEYPSLVPACKTPMPKQV